jgi:hypothetical protein
MTKLYFTAFHARPHVKTNKGIRDEHVRLVVWTSNTPLTPPQPDAWLAPLCLPLDPAEFCELQMRLFAFPRPIGMNMHFNALPKPKRATVSQAKRFDL